MQQPSMIASSAPLTNAHGSYTTGLCDCAQDMHVCIDGWCCTPCEVGYQTNKAKHNSTELHWGSCLGVIAADVGASLALSAGYSCLFGYPQCIATHVFMSLYNGLYLRPLINQRYGIIESTGVSCLKSWCCLPCSMCQQKREMRNRLDHPGGIFSTPPMMVHTYGPPAPAVPGGAVVDPRYGAVHDGVPFDAPLTKNLQFGDTNNDAHYPEKYIE